MNPQFSEESTTVPIGDGQSVTIEPKQPWPAPYRGSRYSVVSDDEYDDVVVKWEHRDLKIFTEPPQGLRRAMVLAGKSGGKGIFRVTAAREVLTKVKADNYSNVDQAPVSKGWIPVYLGKIAKLRFRDVELDPDISHNSVDVWPGLPFNHGETWSVGQDDSLTWKWKDYAFESTFDHPELVQKFKSYRPRGGRIYVTETGHVWGNIDPDSVSSGKGSEIGEAVTSWKTEAERAGDAATLRLVNRRLVATSSTDDPSDGLLPLHLGHLRRFDSGMVPRPVVDDPSYFKVVGQYEQVY